MEITRKQVSCFTNSKAVTDIHAFTTSEFRKHKSKISKTTLNWLNVHGFSGKQGEVCLIPDSKGMLKSVFFGLGDSKDVFNWASIATQLPRGKYKFLEQSDMMEIMWGMESYSAEKPKAKLLSGSKQSSVKHLLDSIYWIRDLINAPANLLGPTELALEASSLTKFDAKVKIIKGSTLDKDYPAIALVGNASDRKPCLIDISWGNQKNKKLTLVGKGVCFDSGGLDLKPPAGMRLMKKDMSGAAHVLGLAKLIMQQNLPINLRVLVPAVENSVSGSAYRPGDIVETRAGIKVEVDNTDAEGRMILCEPLYEASQQGTDLLISMASLTGAASIGLAPDLPSLFTGNESLAREIMQHGKEHNDHIWHMPYHEPYASVLRTENGDLLNSTTGHPYGGSIKAAMFLREFVQSQAKDYLHFDMMCWNVTARPGRPRGGDAMAIRALFSFLQEWSHNRT